MSAGWCRANLRIPLEHPGFDRQPLLGGRRQARIRAELDDEGFRKAEARSSQDGFELLGEIGGQELTAENVSLLFWNSEQMDADEIVREHVLSANAMTSRLGRINDRKPNLSQFRSILGNAICAEGRLEHRSSQLFDYIRDGH